MPGHARDSVWVVKLIGPFGDPELTLNLGYAAARLEFVSASL